MESSATRKRKMKKPPAPPRAAKAQAPAKIRKSKKIIEVEEDASEFRHMVRFPGSSSSRSDSDSDRPSTSTSTSTSTSSSTFSDGRNGLSPSSEELSVYDYEGWEDPLVIVNPRPSSGIPPLTTYSGFDYSGLVYPLPPVFKNPLPPLYYRPKFPDPN
ncbi:hypothetical protein SDJN03_23355, partial [Cucurbita argyrosperma subsp. sororia]